MHKRVNGDLEGHAQFLTFSCERRRKFLSPDQAKRIFLGVLGRELANHKGYCGGFVIMPNHVHLLLWLSDGGPLSTFVQELKQISSFRIHSLFKKQYPEYMKRIENPKAIWQAGYYAFRIYSKEKAIQKLEYMHRNPVRAGLADTPEDWPWSSAQFYENGRQVGVPVSMEHFT
ncbi:MAG: transposase [Planctomycetota bacterium]|nr:transposase [Planctomycetota bacterium]